MAHEEAHAQAGEHIDIGARLREIRTRRRLSLRALAEASGLSINTLSLIERNKTSPSVSTLQRIASALGIPISLFFMEEKHTASIIYTPADQRQRVVIPQGYLERLGSGVPHQCAEPFLLILDPGATSGQTPVVHAGNEFVYCLEGHLMYEIEDKQFELKAGDSLLFEANLPHRWRNIGDTPSKALLVLCAPESVEGLLRRHLH